MHRVAGFAGVLGALLVAQAAQAAHMPYIKPTTFGPKRDFVTLESGMAADHFFAMDFPIRGEGDYWVTGPDGEPVKATGVVNTREFTVVEAALPAAGTYRITTGERPGRAAKWAKVDGEWKMVRPAGGPSRPEAPRSEGARPTGPGGVAPPGGGGRGIEEAAVPAGAETMNAVSYLRAETYVTRGAPDRGALKPTGKGFEAELITHPNEIFAGEPVKLRFLNDGQPVGNVAYAVYRGGDFYEEKRYTNAARSGADGAASLKIEEAGVYVLVATWPGRVEGHPMVPVAKTTTYSLTFEVSR
ncbi:DUF4198 domain-containing protein [Phenylobacterium sp.]|uniref:DUF4198 domain-containing protein n=1 Tax=Phenylobacterium sp. TaxID=1871053 RepID=UPI0025E2DF49|nr:DUF4198 domain-containing protein [Phenylobacterium sp.]